MKVRTALLAEPLVTSPSATIGELLSKLTADRDGTAAVVSPEGKLLGVFGVTDILAEIVPLYIDLNDNLAGVVHDNYLEEHLERILGIEVSTLMVKEVTTVGLDDSLFAAAAKIVEKGCRVLPVLEDGKFLAFVSRSSLLAAVTESQKTA